MMTRKDYRAFAEIIAAEMSVQGDNPQAALAVRNVALSMADVFKRDNGRFDRQKFYAACGID